MSDAGHPPTLAPAGRGTPTTIEPARWQAAVARRSAEARATVPDLDLAASVDVAAALERERELGCGLTVLWVRACALALREHPEANGAYRDGRFERYERVNVGVVVAAPEVYAIPTLFDADRRSARELGAELDDLTARARAGELVARDLSGATFTLSDVGALGVDRATPLVVPPQASAVATGAVRDLAAVRDGAIVPAQAMTVTLACDHRVLYGAAAAAFLMSIKTCIEEAVS
jgi:pyruvate dehydrogenase E2 component (dihydrolipoamide acetyltransferase)